MPKVVLERLRSVKMHTMGNLTCYDKPRTNTSVRGKILTTINRHLQSVKKDPG